MTKMHKRPKAKRINLMPSSKKRVFRLGGKIVSEQSIIKLIEQHSNVDLRKIRVFKAGRKTFIQAIFKYGIQGFYLWAGNKLVSAGGNSPTFFVRSIEPQFRDYGLGKIAIETHFAIARKAGMEKIYHGTSKKSTALLFLSAGMEVVDAEKVFECYNVKSRQELVKKLREMKAKKGEDDIKLPRAIGFEKILN